MRKSSSTISTTATARSVSSPWARVKQSWESLAETFADTLAHEQEVTRRIHALYALAEEEKDYATRQMLNWYIAEQVEEEANVQEIIDNLNLVGQDGTGILQIDRELPEHAHLWRPL